MPTYTTTYSLGKPVVGADEDAWGDTLNTSLDAIDDILDGTTPVTGIDINSGTLDGVTIGGTTAGAGTFTTLTANTSITGTLATAAQTNITSVGTLTGLTVSGSTSLAGASTSADITFGDNDKAIFGAGSDLQIYSNGTNSFISESNATGSLFINASNLVLRNTSGEYYFYGNSDGAVNLYYDNASKLATTSTGIDVTGTVTADGLTVDGVGGSVGSSNVAYIDVTSSYGGLSINASTGNNAFIELMENGVKTAGFNSDATNNVTSVQSANSHALAFNTGSTNERMRITDGGNVGIGTSLPLSKMHIEGGDSGASVFTDTYLTVENSGNTRIAILSGTTGTGGIKFGDSGLNRQGGIDYIHSSDAMTFATTNAERMRIDSSGNLLVGKTSANTYNTTAGFETRPDGLTSSTRDGAISLILNRLTSDGDIAVFRKDGTTVGSIGAHFGDMYVGTGDTGMVAYDFGDAFYPYNPSTLSGRDGAISLGIASNRFKDLYLSGGVYLGGTGSANKLDDYEEGTWTPTFTSWTTNPTSASGRYTKIGRLVLITFKAVGGAKASATSAYIEGLPFAIEGAGAVGSASNSAVLDYGNVLFQNTDRMWFTNNSFSSTWYASGVYETTD